MRFLRDATRRYPSTSPVQVLTNHGVVYAHLVLFQLEL
jgi:hypothetical protein